MSKLSIPSSGTTIVKFGAAWCAPCKTVDAILEDIDPSINVIKVDVDDQPELITEYGVRGIPTILVYHDGDLSATKTGALSAADLHKLIEL